MRFTRSQCAGSKGVTASSEGSAKRSPSPIGVLVAFLAASMLQMTFASLAGAQTSVVAFSQSSFTVNENQSNAVITVVCPGCTNDAVTVNYSTSNGTATAGEDYIATTGTLSFAEGVTTNEFSIIILDDNQLEPDQTVNLMLRNPTGPATLGSLSNAVLTILEQTQQVQFAESTNSVSEANKTNAVINCDPLREHRNGYGRLLNQRWHCDSSLNYVTTTGTVVFVPGIETNTFTIPIL